jgi:hypothetical protein
MANHEARQANADAKAAKARAKAMRPWYKKKRFMIPLVLLVLIVFMTAADTDSDIPEATSSNNSQAQQSSGDESSDESMVESNLSVGDSVTMGSLTHTLESVRWDQGQEFLAPDAGTRWLVADIKLNNEGDDSAAISTMLMWNLLDSDSRSSDMALGASTKGSLDGELGSNRTLRGEIGFVVSEDEDTWELIFEPSVFGFGQAIYTINASDIE